MLRQRQKPTPKTLPEHLLHRTYQNTLRAVGRHVDTFGYQSISIFEVDEGFILRLFASNDPSRIEAIEIPYDDVDALILKNFAARTTHDNALIKSPLCLTGYEDFFRALGFEFDSKHVRAVSVHEIVGAFVVAYMELISHREDYQWVRQSAILGPADVQALLNRAFDRRTTTEKKR